MFLKQLTLRQFRNHRDLDLAVSPHVNLFLGSNGAGKTNIVEAIAVLTTGVSPRGAEAETLAQWGESGFFIKGEFFVESSGDELLTLEMKYRSGSPRQIRMNGGTVIRLKELLGKVPLVSFVPEDLSLVKGEPELRRRAVNMILIQVDASYAEALRRYNDAVKARNAALRQAADGQLSTDDILPWDEAIVETGLDLCRKRDAFIQEFSERVAEIHRRVSGHKEHVSIEYRPSFDGPWDEAAADRWKNKLRSLRAQEMALGSTLVGPHRDDIEFLLDGRSARHYASEGQKRTSAVSFKLAEIPFIESKAGQRPLCILDDVLSELDAQRAERLLDELTRAGQCFVTMTGLESWPHGALMPAAVFHVDASGVRPKNVEIPA